MEYKSTKIDGQAVGYWRGGVGRSLVLLQGGMADAELHWSPVWDLLSESFAVFAPDWPGFGGSKPLKVPTFQRMTKWIDSFRQEVVRAEKIILVGNSFGGTMARLYAAASPDRIECLILIDGGGFIRVGLVQRLLLATPLGSDLARRNARKGFSAEQVRAMFAHPERLQGEGLEAYRRDGSIHLILRSALVGGLPPKITPVVPTLVLWGDSDGLVPVDRGRLVASEIPGAVFEVIRDAGHLPQIEQPVALVRSISQFVAKLRSST